MSLKEGKIRAIVREEVEAGFSRRVATTPKIIKKIMKVADTEYEIALPAETKKFLIHMRETDTSFRLAFERGRVADPKEPYFTIHAGVPYYEDNIHLDQIFKIYVACALVGRIIELIAWV